MCLEKEFLENLTSSKISIKELNNSFMINQDSDKPCGYRAMWTAVITQALMDAGSNSKKIELRKEKARAIAWLNGDSDDFKEVCEMAGFNSDYIKRKSIEAIKNGCKWRIENNPLIKKAS